VLKKLAVFFVFVFVTLINLQAKAAEGLSVVVSDNNPPFSWSEQKIVRGIDVDIVREASKRAGYLVDIGVAPWKRMISMVKSGFADGGTSALYRKSREKFAVYTKVPLRQIQFGAFVRKSSNFSYQSPSSFAGMDVGKIRGYAIGEAFDQAKEAGVFKITEVDSAAQGLKMLVNKRIDVFVSNETVTQYWVKKKGYGGDVKMLHPPVNQGEYVFWIFSRAKYKAEMGAKINDALQSMTDDGTLSSIVQYYMGE